MVIVYLHGFRSSPHGGKTEILRNMFPEHRVVGAEYKPHSPRKAAQKLKILFRSLLLAENSEEEIVVIGTSLGGFWARWVGATFSVKSLIINPSIHPESSLPIGRFAVFGDELKSIDVTQQELIEFSEFKVSDDVAKTLNCVVWVAMNDELLDAIATVNKFEKLHTLRTFSDGGHRFEQFHLLKSDICQFMDNECS